MRHRAFTIVEVLVVIGVIAALVGLLLPALSTVASGGRSARCQSNLRQMGTAAQNYAALYDAYPAAIRYEVVKGMYRRVAWDWVTTFSDQLVSPGPLWGFSDNPHEAQQCPDCNASATFGGDPFTGYNYNTSFIGAEAQFGVVGWEKIRKGVPPHACRRASECVMFGDGGWKSGANKFMRAPMNSEGMSPALLYSGGQAYRHAGVTNFVFIDGHVGSMKNTFEGTLATPDLLKQKMDYPKNAFLSDDDWMYDPR